MPKQLPNTKTVTRNKNDFYLNENENKVFIYGHDLDLFFNETFPKINKPIKIISHNADEGVEERFAKYLDSDKIIKWYAQNAVLNHPKLIPIPIGIANKQWPHGNLDTLKEVLDNAGHKKNILVYKNFDISTNTHVRQRINLITNNNQIFMSGNLPHEQYLKTMASSLFIISPPGNGVDCHRIWEALYLKCIPVVENNICFRGFEDLPILFIKDWNEVTIPYLRSKIDYFSSKQFDMQKLKLSYWRKLINE
jgi:hypothetical protein